MQGKILQFMQTSIFFCFYDIYFLETAFLHTNSCKLIICLIERSPTNSQNGEIGLFFGSFIGCIFGTNQCSKFCTQCR